MLLLWYFCCVKTNIVVGVVAQGHFCYQLEMLVRCHMLITYSMWGGFGSIRLLFGVGKSVFALLVAVTLVGDVEGPGFG